MQLFFSLIFQLDVMSKLGIFRKEPSRGLGLEDFLKLWVGRHEMISNQARMAGAMTQLKMVLLRHAT